jgi:hypothetical protein
MARENPALLMQKVARLKALHPDWTQAKLGAHPDIQKEQQYVGKLLTISRLRKSVLDRWEKASHNPLAFVPMNDMRDFAALWHDRSETAQREEYDRLVRLAVLTKEKQRRHRQGLRRSPGA